MGRRIAIDLNPTPDIVIDGGPIAEALGLDTATFFRLLETRKIDQLCERGIDEDAGLYRASYYYGRKRVRVVVDREGRQQGELEIREREPGQG
ncbi:MAG: hypothetical protein JSS23_03660 [Proteobacteria bacterium]|nr:hypothetical protein [Pseudomonadota bacterium]